MRREALAIVLGVLIGAVVLISAYRGYRHPPPNSFGPDWDCPNIPDAVVCIKRVRPAP